MSVKVVQPELCRVIAPATTTRRFRRYKSWDIRVLPSASCLSSRWTAQTTGPTRTTWSGVTVRKYDIIKNMFLN